MEDDIKTAATRQGKDRFHFSVMATIDSVNQQKIFKILDSRGFVGKDKVGDACRAYWLVVQHSSVEMQRKYLPLFLKAAERGDIPRENVAMMEDRICLSKVVHSDMAPNWKKTRTANGIFTSWRILRKLTNTGSL